MKNVAKKSAKTVKKSVKASVKKSPAPKKATAKKAVKAATTKKGRAPRVIAPLGKGFNAKTFLETVAVRPEGKAAAVATILAKTYGKEPVETETVIKTVYGKNGKPTAFNMVVNGIRSKLEAAKADYTVVRKGGTVGLAKAA